MGERSAPTGESQKHGFIWQSDLMTNVYGVSAEAAKAESYTAQHDIPAQLNALDHVDLSIKTTGNKKRVDMGDALRIYDAVSSGKAFHMTVVLWKQEGDQKKLVSVTEVNLTGAAELLFGSLTRADIVQLDSAIKAFPKGCSAKDPSCAPITRLCTELNSRSGALMLNKKIDSKSQRRLQCSFNNFCGFVEAHPERVIATTLTCEFRGGRIQESITSGQRVRNVKSETDPQSV
jgi:hypothetical protein